MSKTALVDALMKHDLEKLQQILERRPELERLRLDGRFDLLQYCCKRSTHGDPDAADRQLRMATWLVGRGFDPLVIHTTEPDEDGEEEPAGLSLVWFALAKARNNRLARYFLERGAAPHGLFAAAWWGNGEIVPDLVRHGADLNESVGGTPLHMAVDVVRRGVEGNPELARRRLRLLETLLELGADPNIASSDGTTPLHTALKKEYSEAFELLLQNGADPDVPDKDGRTVREIAARKRDKSYLGALAAAAVRSGNDRSISRRSARETRDL